MIFMDLFKVGVRVLLLSLLKVGFIIVTKFLTIRLFGALISRELFNRYGGQMSMNFFSYLSLNITIFIFFSMNIYVWVFLIISSVPSMSSEFIFGSGDVTRYRGEGGRGMTLLGMTELLAWWHQGLPEADSLWLRYSQSSGRWRGIQHCSMGIYSPLGSGGAIGRAKWVREDPSSMGHLGGWRVGSLMLGGDKMGAGEMDTGGWRTVESQIWLLYVCTTSLILFEITWARNVEFWTRITTFLPSITALKTNVWPQKLISSHEWERGLGLALGSHKRCDPPWSLEMLKWNFWGLGSHVLEWRWWGVFVLKRRGDHRSATLFRWEKRGYHGIVGYGEVVFY